MVGPAKGAHGERGGVGFGFWGRMYVLVAVSVDTLGYFFFFFFG